MGSGAWVSKPSVRLCEDGCSARSAWPAIPQTCVCRDLWGQWFAVKPPGAGDTSVTQALSGPHASD